MWRQEDMRHARKKRVATECKNSRHGSVMESLLWEENSSWTGSRKRSTAGALRPIFSTWNWKHGVTRGGGAWWAREMSQKAKSLCRVWGGVHAVCGELFMQDVVVVVGVGCSCRKWRSSGGVYLFSGAHTVWGGVHSVQWCSVAILNLLHDHNIIT